MSIVCQFDQSVHESLESLHSHLRRFKVSQKLYYTTYFVRVDKLTNEPIPWKDREQYLAAEFASKTNLKRWLNKNKEEGLKWSKQWLINRKQEKDLIYAPSQVELRTLMCPSIPYYDSVAISEGGYYGVTENLGFLPRYINGPLSFLPLATNTAILQDSREQKPLHLSIVSQQQAIDVGDYALASPHDRGIRIERKSLSDFCGTMSGRKVKHENKTKATRIDSSFERFDRELARAKENNLYVIMVVESDINEAQSFPYLPQTRHLKISPSYVMHNMRALLTKYPLHFQALFVAGRQEMARIVVRLFELGNQVKTTDLQLAYERKLL